MIRDRIAECDARNSRPVVGPEFIVIHKTSLRVGGTDNPSPISDEDLDGVGLVRTFAAQSASPPNGLGTSGLCPYHLLVRADGVVEQMLPLSVRGAHAREHNSKSWAVAYVGERPTTHQVRALVRTCTALVLASVLVGGKPARIVGHTSLPGASRDPGKVCPHESLDLRKLEGDVLARLAAIDQWRTDRDHVATLVRAEGLSLGGVA